MYSAIVGSAIRALKAAVEPRLMRDSKQQIIPTRIRAGNGTCSVG